MATTQHIVTRDEALNLRAQDFNVIFTALERERLEINLQLENGTDWHPARRGALVGKLVSIERQQKALVNIMGALESALYEEEQLFKYELS